MKVLLLSASLRSARGGQSLNSLAKELSQLDSKEELTNFLKEQAKYHKENFPTSLEGDFYKQYKDYRKSTNRNKGLSNSEVGLAAAAWKLIKQGNTVTIFSLSEAQSAHSAQKKLEPNQELLDLISSSDAILLSTPVYFGDRSSPAQYFFQHIKISASSGVEMSSKFFAGIAAGAKRNGGQETTLIYSLVDASLNGLLVVGNDSATTSQYGGTLHAGDIGTAAQDDYGINTAIGTGSRLSRAILQDSLKPDNQINKVSLNHTIITFGKSKEVLIKAIQNNIHEFHNLNHLDMSEEKQLPCLACDFCPTHVGPDEEYRCIIKPSSKDSTSSFHDILIDTDILFVYIDEEESDLWSYQRFIERTRYIRRGDYALGDITVVPIISTSSNKLPTFHFRLLTSFIRHHTIIAPPIFINQNSSKETINERINIVTKRAQELSTKRLFLDLSSEERYSPVGYVISSTKDNLDMILGKRQETVEERLKVREKRTVASQIELNANDRQKV